MKLRGYFATVVLLSVSGLVSQAFAADTMGELEGPEYLLVKGAEAFTSENINLALFSDHEVLRASHPAAPRMPFAMIVRKKILLGYEHLGFPDARVETEFNDAGKLIVTVSEGRRYAAGEMRVEGNNAVGTDAIRDAIAEVRAEWEKKAVPGEEPKWAGFSAPCMESVRHGVAQAYARAGRLFPKFETDIVPNAGEQVADLVVKVLDEGPLCILDRVQVTGCERSSPEDVIRVGGLRVGETVTSDLMGKAYADLIETGRLRAALLTYSPSGERLGGVEVAIRIVEYEKAPPLSVPQTREERACLRFRNWLIEFFSGRCEGDLVERTSRDGDVAVVISPKKGLFFSLGAAFGWDLTSMRLLAEGGLLVAVSGKGEDKLTIPLEGNMLGLALTVSPDAPEEPEPTFSMSYNASLGKQDSSPQSDSFGKAIIPSGSGSNVSVSLRTTAWVGAFKIETDLHPAGFVALTLKKDVSFLFEDGVFSIVDKERPDETFLQIDEDTGRLIGFDLGPDEGDDGPGLYTRVERGAFARERASLLADAAEAEERYDPEAPWASGVAFAIDAFMAKDLLETFFETELPAAEVLLPALRRKLADAVVAAGRTFQARMGDEFAGDEDDEESFYVPASPGFLEGRMTLGAMFAPMAWDVAHIFPPKTWPRTAGRGAALAMLGERRYLDADLRMLHADKRVGPAGCLGLAYLASMLDPRPAVWFAEKGLGEITLAGIRKDCRTVLELEYAARLAEALVETLRGTDREMVVAAAGLLPEEEAVALRDTFAVFDAHADAPPAEIAMLALQAWWEVAFEDWIRSGFAPFYEDYSRMALAKRDPRTAATAAAKAISLAPERAGAYGLRATAFATGGLHPRAIDDFGKAIELDPKAVLAWAGRARSLAATGDNEGAVRDFGKAIELDPELATAWYERAKLFTASGDTEAAKRDFTKAIELAPEIAAAWYERAKIFAADGDAEAAERDFAKTMELAPEAAAPYLARGKLLAASGDTVGARRDFQKAAALDPEGEVGRAARAEIEGAEAEPQPVGAEGPAIDDNGADGR